VVRFSDQPFIYFLSPKLLLKRNGKPGEKMIYSTSVMSMVKLLEMEETLKASLEIYIQEMQSKLDIIKQ